jgi:hypothetical protein
MLKWFLGKYDVNLRCLRIMYAGKPLLHQDCILGLVMARELLAQVKKKKKEFLLWFPAYEQAYLSEHF